MQRELWRQSYGSFARMTCPNCNKGMLRMMRDSFQRLEPEHIRRDLENDQVGDEVSMGRFTGFLKCDARLCGEIVALAGYFTTHYHHDNDQETGEPITNESYSYRPFVMRPAPRISTVPKGLNSDSRFHLHRAFELFWADHASSANRLRIVVEYLLDQLKIPRSGLKGRHKNARLDLADRIDLLKVAKPGHEDALTALRFVGNVGSHEGVVDFEDLLDCYELLEDAMVELIEDRRAKLAAKAQRIIASKGKPAP